MFSPLCLAPCRNRSVCGSSPWWRWCSRMRSSSRPSSPSWPRGARVSRRWYGVATARPARSRRPFRTCTASSRPRSSASRSRRSCWATCRRIPSRTCSATGSRRCRRCSTSSRVAAWRPPSRWPSCRSCTSCSASRRPRRGRSPLPNARAAGSRGRSRYAVYGESLDDMLGVVHAKDILAGLRAARSGTLRAVLRPAMFVPGTREVEDVLADMKRQKIHLAIVLDEFGGTAGLVTMEDLLEEIVGQIYDEYDRPSGELRVAPAGVAPIIAGSVPIREVNSAFGLELGEQDYTTIGGFLFGAIGRLPRPGDQVAVKGAVFEIVEVEGRRVATVRVLRRGPAAQA